MHSAHKFLSTVPFDLYELGLYNLVVTERSFTKAAQAVGLTQSAVTRQVQAMELSLGVKLLERTTRSIRVTPAGEFLQQEAKRLLGDVERSLQRIASEYAGAAKEVRVTISSSIGLAYLPGFFHANLRRLSNVTYRVNFQSSSQIISALEANEHDLGVLCPPARLPNTLRVTHRFVDTFALVVPAEWSAELENQRTLRAKLAWLTKKKWLLLDEKTNTGGLLRSWLRKNRWQFEPTMQLDNFDLIINLASLGMGASFVPIRALAPYNQKGRLARVVMPLVFKRELVVLVRKQRNMPQHLQAFIDNVLFA
jgi:DNA-binding transcriptional LysR family regulator